MILALLAAALLVAAGLIGLLRRGVDPLKSLRELRERSLGRLLWLSLFAVCAVHQGATKFTNGLSGASSPQRLLQNLPPTLDGGAGSGSIFPAYTNAVTNLTFTGIMDVPASNAVYLGVTWPSNAVLPFSLIDVFAKHDLVTNAWEVVGTAMVDTNLASAMIEVPYLSLPDGYRKSMFFRVGSYIDSDGDGLTDAFEHLVTKTDPQLPDSDLDLLDDGTEFAQGLDPNVADTDGDGLDDIDEAGSVRRLSDFEWYDLSGCTPSFGKEPGLWSYFGASLTLDFASGVNLCGLDCQGAVMFDNGYVSISAPGDFNGWVFPEVPMPLAHAYNSGSILVAPYWKGSLMAQYGNTNSFIRAGHLAAEGVTVFEFHDVRDGYSSANGMTFQVIVPDGTGNVVRVSYLSSDIWLDGGGAVVGVHNRRRVTPSGYYNIAWNFDRLGPILPGTTVEYRLGLGTDPAAADPDGDGLSDADEIRNHGTDPWKADTDGDGLDDDVEVLDIHTNPCNADTDGDGLRDGWEIAHGFNPNSAPGLGEADDDPDGDGLTNIEEQNAGTRPNLADTDGDGLVDGDEVSTYHTNPLKADTDDDGLTDDREVALGCNPNNSDSDADGLLDGWEVEHSLDPFSGIGDDGANGDPDYDQLCNLLEHQVNANPRVSDSDGDGVSDYQEVCNGSDPADDTDQGQPSARSPYRGLRFNVYGDYAAWRMTIAGLGPIESGTDTVTMDSPGASDEKLKILRKGNSYRLTMTWLNSNGHTDPYSWYCWQATINGQPRSPTYQSYHSTRLTGNEIVYGTGWMAENADGLLTSHVHMHDPVNGLGGGNVAEGLEATLHVYKCEVAICAPDDERWPEIEEARVLLDNEELRIKIRIEPAIDTFEHCQLVMGSNVTVITSGTCPGGAAVAIATSDFSNHGSYSEIRIARSRQQLIGLGLLPAQDEDGVDEMAWLDMADLSSGSGQNLTDSEAFAGLGYRDRGTACRDVAKTLKSTPPCSIPSESYFKSAGREVIMVSYGGVNSKRRQIMNQADYLYCSGHGSHLTGKFQGMIAPEQVASYWSRELKCVIFSACSILDINDYNDNYDDPVEHVLSPGKRWEQSGPDILLGYAYIAPSDESGAPARIVNSWRSNRDVLGDEGAWMKANFDNNAWNACAILKGKRYLYFKRKWLSHKVVAVPKEEW